MIKILIELELNYPFSQSLSTLINFCIIYESVILRGGTNNPKSRIIMPLNYFKRIFNSNPCIKEYNLPSGMEKFAKKIKVLEIIAK